MNSELAIETRLQRAGLRTQTDVGVSTFRTWLFALSMSGQIALTRWLALRARLLGAARFGSDTTAALEFGAQLEYGYGAGLALRLWRGSRLQLSATAEFERVPGARFSPLPAALDLAVDGQGNLLSRTATMSGFGGLGCALALLEWLGLTAATRFGFELGELDRQQEVRPLFDGAITVGADLGALSVVPLGLLVGFRTTLALSSAPAPVHVYAIGLSYTGRRDLGLQLEGLLIDRAEDGLLGVGGSFSMRYYF